MAVNKQKIDEFRRLTEMARILILQGPPGCGKNAMIKAHCKERGIKLERFVDTNHLIDPDVDSQLKVVG